ncbi:MAG TPA: MFS transporter [Acidimicrobiales bacterium]|nr:MFS transporter [Acidimicrobiales bacterium]
MSQIDSGPDPVPIPGPQVMTPGMVLLFAAACGISVANLYYAQPLLPSIARSFHTASGTTTLIVTGAQVGYGLGLALLVPLGDMLIRRRLVPGILVVSAAALFAAALAPSVGFLIAAAAVAGVCSVAAQILVPFGAQLADDGNRGQVVGTIMSGLLIGVLLARTFSGLIAQAAGWRAVYVVGGALVLALVAILSRALPAEDPRPHLDYPELLGSVVHLMRSQPVLRLRSTFGGLLFAAFGVLWTSLAFLLSTSPYHYSQAVIGLFGLLGASGALMASLSGRLADRGHERLVTGASLAMTAGSFGLLFLGAHQLWALIAGIIVADLGIQSVHIQNQQLIFAIDPNARSRLNTGYMVCYFVGGAIGSSTAGLVYSGNGWTGVVILGAAYSGAALALWLVSQGLRLRRDDPLLVARRGKNEGHGRVQPI